MKTSERIDQGIALLRKRNSWCQYQMERRTDDGTQYCALGACGAYTDVEIALDKATFKMTRGRFSSIVWYNDTPGRKKYEVLAVMRAASKALKAEGK